MARKTELANGSYYHIFNRGVEKRDIFSEKEDLDRFFQSMTEFNTESPVGSIYENYFRKNKLRMPLSKKDKLVDFVCYCLNPNHYHFILKQIKEDGISKFMQRLGTGYTNYFNQKYRRSGVLFQGPFKAVHIDSNEYLLHLSVYVNLNNKVHRLGSEASKSSWEEFTGKYKTNFCEKDIVLGQFKNPREYQKFARTSLEWIKENRESAKLLLD